MAPMRIFWLALLMVLLPLRGWTGDVMATGMAAGETQSAAHAAQAMQGSPDCAGHDTGSSTHADGACDSCSACQACHTLALLVPASSLAPLQVGRTRAPAGADRFASADAAPDQKPPIS